MPHVIVKLWPGKSKRQKQDLADKITMVVMETLHCGEDSVFGRVRRGRCERLDGEGV
jgi:phenylpyruvate tautomerase PptA (4-oxalocrotonate tautomerase family)